MQQIPDNLFFDTQKSVCQILNSSPSLSAVGFLAENDKDIETEITKALNKQGICGIVSVNSATFQGFSADESFNNTAWNIDELVVQLVENPIVNRSSLNRKYVGTASDAAYKASQILGGYNRHGTFNLKSYDLGEEEGLIVAKVTMQCLVTTDLSAS